MPALTAEARPGVNGGGEREVLLERLKERKEPSLGELNPLLFPPDLGNPEAVEAIKLVARRKIDEYEGLQPASLESSLVHNATTDKQELRLVVRFELETLTQKQIEELEQLVRLTYGASVRTRTNPYGGGLAVTGYPELEKPQDKNKKQKTSAGGRRLGWYFGPNLETVANTHRGLLVYRDLGTSDMANFLKGRGYREWFFNKDIVDPITRKPIQTKYLVEIREDALYQTDLVEFITQASSVLSGKDIITDRRLKYWVYNDLNRLGLKKAGQDTIYGLDEQLRYIERVLILPLANLNLASSIDLHAGSVLLVGVPGTGKTLVAEYFLQQDTGVFLVPIDPLHLARELQAKPEEKKLIPRISRVFAQTGIPIVLHIDDIENIVQGKEQNILNSTLLNLMAGVRESGFFVLASTNHPEQLNEQLLQPQRFAHAIYFGLPTPEARYGILDKHATMVSKELGHNLFPNREERHIILEAVADDSCTQLYTPRFLAEIATTAKSFLLERVAREKAQKIGLAEKDLNITFTVEDWAQALEEVNRKYNKQAVRRRDEELKEFVRRHQHKFGISSQPTDGRLSTSLRVTLEQIAATRLNDPTNTTSQIPSSSP